MSKYGRVAQTYLYRPRFWTFAAVYLLMVYWWFSGIDKPLWMFASANLGALAGAFLALHLRRQFGTAAARVVPGFAVPHLLVGFVAGLLVWLVFPAVCVAIGQWPPRALALTRAFRIRDRTGGLLAAHDHPAGSAAGHAGGADAMVKRSR